MGRHHLACDQVLRNQRTWGTTEVRSHKNQTPFELAWALQYLHPQQDRSRIIQLLAEGGPTK
jgi:hypothetical protein